MHHTGTITLNLIVYFKKARCKCLSHIFTFFGLHPSSLSKSAGFVFLSGKASLVSISAAILLLRSSNVYFLLEFEFRGKSCVE